MFTSGYGDEEEEEEEEDADLVTDIAKTDDQRSDFASGSLGSGSVGVPSDVDRDAGGGAGGAGGPGSGGGTPGGAGAGGKKPHVKGGRYAPDGGQTDPAEADFPVYITIHSPSGTKIWESG